MTIGLIIAAVVVVIAIVGAIWFFSANAQVPNVVGTAPDQAILTLTAAGFKTAPLAYTPTVSPVVAKDLIVSESSPAGSWVMKGSVITLTVNGPHMLPVPTVTGLSEADAIAKLEGGGFKAGQIKQSYSSSVPTGRVITGTPAGGVQAEAGSPVALTVSKGIQLVVVPNVVNRDQAVAINTITGLALRYSTTRVYNSTIQPGNVISQSPAAGVKIQVGTVVSLTVSKGAKPIPTAGVPGVVGSGESTAAALIQKAGFTVTIKTAPVLAQDVGIVVDQDPVQGTMLAKGSAVTIWIGKLQPTKP